MKAPDFSLPDQDDKIHSLDNYHGKWVVLYFYPKDDTPGCTKEACSFQDAYTMLGKKNVVLLGVSKDTVKSHKKFAEKFHLLFPLLSDPSAETIKAYKSWGKKKFMGKEYDGILRNTVLINPQGEIEKEYHGVNPLTHVAEVLNDLEVLQK
jgi:peroxiredoxin Q/BCP